MLISVIIPTRNRAALLDNCLAALTEQSLPGGAFEAVVVDNNSTDGTRAVLAAYEHRLPLVIRHAAEPGLHAGRHAGMRGASSDILVFADDDIVPESEWLEALVEIFDDPAVDMAGGNNLPLFESEPPAWLREWWEQPAHPPGRALGYLSILDFGVGRFEIDPAYVWGCNFAIRRDVLEVAGGFHPDAFPRELVHLRGDGETHVSDHVRNRGGKAMFDSRASVRHRVPAQRMRREYFEWRAYLEGISASYRHLRDRGGAFAHHVMLAETRSRLGAALRHLGMRLTRAADARIELANLQKQLARSHWAGFRDHQERCRTDPALLEWVMQKDYMGLS